MKDLSWMDRAACANADPRLFFPPPGDPGKAAKKICAGCDVQLECAAFARSLGMGRGDGVWGGMSGDKLATFGTDRTPVEPGNRRVSRERLEAVRAMWEADLHDGDVADRLGISRQQARHARSLLGLESRRAPGRPWD